jgi:hypothetical protein
MKKNESAVPQSVISPPAQHLPRLAHHIKTSRLAAAGMMILLLAGCAGTPPPRVKLDSNVSETEANKKLEQVLKEDNERMLKLNQIAYRVKESAADMCPVKEPQTGLVLVSINSYHEQLRPAAERVLGMDERVRVLYVLPGSPAQLAGIQPGDVLAKIGEEETNTGLDAVNEVFRAIEKNIPPDGMVAIGLKRGGVDREVKFPNKPVCASKVQLAQSDMVAALSNDERIIVTSGMVDYAAGDDEIAFVVAHELGHNLSKHTSARNTGAIVGRVIGSIIQIAVPLIPGGQIGQAFGATAGAHDREFLADELAVKIMQHAGYNPKKAIDFWDRTEKSPPEGMKITWTMSHPGVAERKARLTSILSPKPDESAKAEMATGQ